MNRPTPMQNDARTTGLKACPFCGGEAYLREGHREHWRAECTKCGATIGQFFANRGRAEDQRLATEAWNTRTPALETQGAHEGVIEAWQPIETAPKDGAVVDLWGEDLGRMTDCYWGRPSHECGEMGEYCDSDWHFDTRESWVDGTFNERLSNTFITHWTLPPQPPALSSGKAALKSPDHILDPVEGKGEHPAS